MHILTPHYFKIWRICPLVKMDLLARFGRVNRRDFTFLLFGGYERTRVVFEWVNVSLLAQIALRASVIFSDLDFHCSAVRQLTSLSLQNKLWKTFNVKHFDLLAYACPVFNTYWSFELLQLHVSSKAMYVLLLMPLLFITFCSNSSLIRFWY